MSPSQGKPRASRVRPAGSSAAQRGVEQIRLQIEEITPERAYELLANNTNNRNLRPRVVERYARDMKNGHWMVGAGEPIHVAPNGAIGNGQHRLMAVIEANISVQLPFLYAPLEYRRVADQGVKRRFADVLKIEYNEQNTHTLASAIRLLDEFRREGTFDRRRTDSSVLELVERYTAEPGITRSVKRASRTNTKTGVRPAVAVMLHYLFSQVDAEAADRFFDRLESGASLEDGDPILAARRWLFSKSRTDRVRDQAVILIKAFNMMRDNKKTRYFKSVGEVPPIVGLPTADPLG